MGLTPEAIAKMEFSVSITAGDAAALTERYQTFDAERLAGIEADVEKAIAARAAGAQIAETVLGLAKILAGSGLLHV